MHRCSGRVQLSMGVVITALGTKRRWAENSMRQSKRASRRGEKEAHAKVLGQDYTFSSQSGNLKLTTR